MGMDRFLLVTKEMIEPGSMAVVEEHHIRGKSVGVFNPVLVISEPEPHTFVLPEMSSDAYLLLLSFDQNYRKTAIGLLLVEQGATWKVLTVYAGGAFSVGGKSARAWFEEARTLELREELIPAMFRILAAEKCLRPINAMQYGYEKEVQELARTLRQRLTAKYRFPIPLSEVPGTPQILGLDISFGENQVVPLVAVLTSTRLSDTISLEAEATHIDRALVTHLPGYCTGAKIHTLMAYNEAPTDPKKVYVRYGLTRPCP
jgi:hypothetical protein